MMNIVHELRRAKGTTKKLDVLRTQEHNEDWLECLRLMYDTSINYYVSAPKDNTFIPDDELDCKEMFTAIGAFISRQYVGNRARDMALHCSQQYGAMFRLILSGSLKAGVSTTSINKAYPGLINEFKVMLAKDVEIDSWPVAVSTKYDGVRILAFVTKDGVQLKTRNGKELDLTSLKEQMATCAEGVYDGELVHGNGMQAGRTAITGDVNKVLKGSTNEINNYKYCVFDVVSLTDWATETSTELYSDRYSKLHSMPVLPNVMLATQFIIEQPKEVDMLFETKLRLGYEGIIIRYMNDPYVWARTPRLIKKKAIKDCVLMCVDYEEGRGKYQSMLGALICEGTVEGVKVEVKVGTGLSDYDRGLDFNDNYKDQLVEVCYNDIVKSKSKEINSLFLPVFKRIRRHVHV